MKSHVAPLTGPSTLLSLYGLKWNPFQPGVPVEGLHVSPRLESFARRAETYVREGGFAMLTGAPGTGKSAALRALDDRLCRMRDVLVRPIEHPSSGVGDFYCELGDLFGVSLSPRNRWGGFKAIREMWQAHIETTLVRPVITIDEAQELPTAVLSELRLLTSRDYDSRSLLFVILAGDARLRERLKQPDLLPLRSRIRAHVEIEPATANELADCLRHLLATAGNAQLMTPAVITTLAEHAGGNYRTLAQMGADLLSAATDKDARQIDEKLFFEVFALPQQEPPAKATKRR
jgi:type II secretory pathway predicted ATPase ExeA